MTLAEGSVYLRESGKIGIVRLWMTFDEYPHFLKIGLEKDQTTQQVEELGRQLIADGFREAECLDFVRQVCKWGGDSRRGAMVLRNNSPEEISIALEAAQNACLASDRETALKAITSLFGLHVSFGSKHLKFLDPSQHVVLDSIIAEALGFSRSVEGYLAFSDHCRAILEVLKRERVPYTGFSADGWRIADVEMAIYYKIRSEL